MRDFLWSYFAVTGEIDAYLMYKQHEYAGTVPVAEANCNEANRHSVSDAVIDP